MSRHIGGPPCPVPRRTRESTQKNADTTALKANKISIVPMSGDWTAKPTAGLTKVVQALQ
jgi:hypothetical protein